MSGITSDKIYTPEGYNQGVTKRYRDRCAYGYPLNNSTYLKVEGGDPYTLWNMMRRVCIAAFQPRVPERYYRIIYSGKGDSTELEHRRAILLKSAKTHDKTYPFDIWMTITVTRGEEDVNVSFYNTVESLLVTHLFGKCVMDCTTAGMTRIIKPDSVTRIFYLSPAGVGEYYKMKFNPISKDLNIQNKHMGMRLIATKGLAFNPGKRFLRYSDPSFSLNANGIIKNYTYTGFNNKVR